MERYVLVNHLELHLKQKTKNISTIEKLAETF